MKFSSPAIDIHSETFHDELSLYFKFKGKFTEEASIRSTQAWHRQLDQNPLTKYHFIWDCADMSGFEISARKIWYKYMNLHKRQINGVVVISGSILIRNAARVMLEFFGLEYTVVKTKEKYEEINELVDI